MFGNVWHPCSQGNKLEEVLLLILGKLPKYLYQLPAPHSIKIFWQFSQNGWESLPKVTFPRATLCSVSVNKSPKEVNWFSKSYRVADLGSDFSILVLFHYLKLPPFQVPLKCNWTSSGKLHNKLLTEIMFLQWEWRDGSEENFTFSPSSCVIETLFILPFAFSGDFFFFWRIHNKYALDLWFLK